MFGISIPTYVMSSYTTRFPRILYDPSIPDEPNYEREREREWGKETVERVSEESARVSEGSMR